MYMKPGVQWPKLQYSDKYSINSLNVITQEIELFKIYRVEDSLGQGMYSSRLTSKVDLYSDGARNHPGPSADKQLTRNLNSVNTKLQTQHLFGFVSKEQLRKWLYRDEWIEQLHEVGLFCSIIYLPNKHRETYFIGDSQAIYDSNKVVRKEEISMLTFLETKLQWEDYQ